jgi:hypothetical protein
VTACPVRSGLSPGRAALQLRPGLAVIRSKAGTVRPLLSETSSW